MSLSQRFYFLMFTSIAYSTLVSAAHLDAFTKQEMSINQSWTSNAVVNEGECWEVVVVSDEIRAVPPPSWLQNWSDIEFGAPCGMFPKPYVGKSSNLTEQAAYLLYAFSGERRISEEYAISKQDDLPSLEQVLYYFETREEYGDVEKLL